MKMDSKFEDDMAVDSVVKHREKKHKLMTMEDVANELSGDFEDEISDSKKYYHMAKIADRAGDDEDCHYLTEMAKDEYTHAYFIHNFMKEHDIHIPEEQEKAFEELTDMMKEFFY